MPTGLAVADGILGSKVTRTLLRVCVLLLVLVCAYYVFRVGDLGAKAVWAGRIPSGGGFGPPVNR